MSSPQLPSNDDDESSNNSDSGQPLYTRDEERGEELLEEPLLLSNDVVPFGFAGFKILSFTAGSLIAVASQLILAIFMWNDGILEQPVGGVLIFSLLWSFWTCVMIFGGLYLLMHCLQKSYYSDDEAIKMQDSDILQLEVYNVVGALSAVSLAWLVNDVLHVRNTFLADPLHQWMVIGVCLSGYALFCIWMVMQSCQSFSQARRRQRGMMNIDNGEGQSSLYAAFRLIAGLLGLVTGACSQFFLAAVLWDATMQQPIIHNVIGFSFVWSLITVAITTAVCASLKFLARHSSVGDYDDVCVQQAEDETKSSSENTANQILQLRMEASFVSCTLVGICFAWVMMDVFMDMTEQILPSLALLAVSLILFRLILVCLPEEQCLQEKN